jgi:NAD-dependent protein deacetylase/lipoamidase sirtuin 4
MSVDALAELFAGRRLVALTGAGCSTESGIPDYRGEGTRKRARAPLEYRAFVADPAARRRYWARSMLGFSRFSGARPNAAHSALAELEASRSLVGVITQNVDRLHQAAGSRRVIELHGALERVRCLGCGAEEPRAEVQTRLERENPEIASTSSELLPDGDAELASALTERLVVPDCRRCGGVLKPDVVFFGESVPRPVVDSAYELLAEGDALLVVGSSLAVFSGYRFVRKAAESGMPVGIVNLGSCRGDAYATVRVSARAGVALPALARSLERLQQAPQTEHASEQQSPVNGQSESQ